MILLGFLYPAVFLIAFGMGIHRFKESGAAWMLAFLLADAIANGAGLWEWSHHHMNQWVANLGTLAAAGLLIPAFATWGAHSLRWVISGISWAAVAAWLAYFHFHPLAAWDDSFYPATCMLVILTSGSVLIKLSVEPDALPSRMHFWMSAGALLVFTVDLMPWAMGPTLARINPDLLKELWIIRNGAWTAAGFGFAFGWTRP